MFVRDPRPRDFSSFVPESFLSGGFFPPTGFAGTPVVIPERGINFEVPEFVGEPFEPGVDSEPVSILNSIGDFISDVFVGGIRTAVGAQPDISTVGGIVGGIIGTVADFGIPDIFRPAVEQAFPGPMPAGGTPPFFETGGFTGPLRGLPILSPGMTSGMVPVGAPIGVPVEGELVPEQLAQCAPPPGWVITTSKRGVVSMHPKIRRRARRAYPPTVWNQMLLAAKAFAPGDRVIVLSGLARR